MKKLDGKSKKDLVKKSEEIEKAIYEADPKSEEFHELVASLLEVRNVLQQKAEYKATKRMIQPKEWLSAGVTVGSLLLILNYEKTDVITSKGFSIVSKFIGR